jgi:hypothetical protein
VVPGDPLESERNLTFSHHNVFNPGFNPDPALPRYAPFPMDDGTATLIVALSVFTHTTQQQTEHYLGEVASCMIAGHLSRRGSCSRRRISR